MRGGSGGSGGSGGGLRTATTGTYTASDGSSGTVRTSTSTRPTRDGYTDSYRQVLVGPYDGRAPRITVVFKVSVGEVVDVKVQRAEASCGA